jgi:nitrate/nitrite transport system substrate-binding protein
VSAVLEARAGLTPPRKTNAKPRSLSRRGWLNTKEQYLTGRMLGEYDNGLGRAGRTPSDPLLQRGRGQLPWLSDGMWFLTQFRRWGCSNRPDYARWRAH